MKLFLLCLLISPAAVSAAEIAEATAAATNLAEVARNLKLERFKGQKFRRKIKIAVLDNGFRGWSNAKGETLPRDVEYVPKAGNIKSAADDISELKHTDHGLAVAQVIHQVLKNSGAETDYQIVMYYAFGYTRFANAVADVIEKQFDIVVYAQVWEFGGNGDGRGYINTEVSKATAAGIVWINAAGNYGRKTKWLKVDGKVESGEEYVRDSATIQCSPVGKATKCAIRLIAAWMDFKDDAVAGTDKDLDLYLEDSNGKTVAKKLGVQVLKDEGVRDSTMLPREMIEKEDLEKGTYKARLRIISKNFSASQDRVRITVEGDGLTMKDPSLGDTVFPPADHPQVITVGASDDRNSSWSEKDKRPDVQLKSTLKLKNGAFVFSSSIAAAMAGGVAALHLGIDTDRVRDDVLAKLKLIDGKSRAPAAKKSAARTIEKVTTPGPAVKPAKDTARRSSVKRSPSAPKARARGVAATGDSRPAIYPIKRSNSRDCLPPAPLPGAHANAQRILSSGGVSVMFRNRHAIVVPVNFPKLQGIEVPKGMSVFVYPGGLAVSDPRRASSLPPDYFEVIPSYTTPPVCSSTRRPRNR